MTMVESGKVASVLDVRIVRLDPMTVASAYGFGTRPEDEAWQKLEAWAAPQDIFDDVEGHPTFGFNNPDPSPASPNYGYELWMQVEPESEGNDDIEIKEFDGGLYAVTRFTGLSRIGQVWRALLNWREESGYKPAVHQWLEHVRNPGESGIEKMVFDLYLPIAE